MQEHFDLTIRGEHPFYKSTPNASPVLPGPINAISRYKRREGRQNQKMQINHKQSIKSDKGRNKSMNKLSGEMGKEKKTTKLHKVEFIIVEESQ